MLTNLLNIIMTILGSAAFVGSVGYIVTLGNRVTKVETKQEDLPDLIRAQFVAVNQRLERIEKAMNGALSHHTQE